MIIVRTVGHTWIMRKVGEVDMTEYIVRYENEYLQLLPDKMQELVRCKDCKHASYCSIHEIKFSDDWFCADGKRNGSK